jgi:hypothetical protein
MSWELTYLSSHNSPIFFKIALFSNPAVTFKYSNNLVELFLSFKRNFNEFDFPISQPPFTDHVHLYDLEVFTVVEKRINREIPVWFLNEIFLESSEINFLSFHVSLWYNVSSGWENVDTVNSDVGNVLGGNATKYLSFLLRKMRLPELTRLRFFRPHAPPFQYTTPISPLGNVHHQSLR